MNGKGLNLQILPKNDGWNVTLKKFIVQSILICSTLYSSIYFMTMSCLSMVISNALSVTNMSQWPNRCLNLGLKKDDFLVCMVIKWTEWNSSCHKVWIVSAQVLADYNITCSMNLSMVNGDDKGWYTLKSGIFCTKMWWMCASKLLAFPLKWPKCIKKMICSVMLFPLLDCNKSRTRGICPGVLPYVIQRPTDRLSPIIGVYHVLIKLQTYTKIFHFLIILSSYIDKL